MSRKPVTHPVERYYDRNTRRFLAFGGGLEAHAIHRQLWPPGVTTVTGAAGCINRLLAEALRSVDCTAPSVLVDLGCGVGGTLLHLAGEFPGAQLHGVTISRRQIDIAERAVTATGLGDRVRFHCADFESLELGFDADVLVAIEAFTHSRKADDFMRTASRHLGSGGSLIVVDDFMTRHGADLSPDRQRLLRDLRDGWRLPSLCTTGDCIAAAGRHGLILDEQRDLTRWIRLDRPRDRLIGLAAPLAARLGLARVPFFGNLVGGHALNRGLRQGVVAYRWLRFRRSPHQRKATGRE